MNQQPNHAERHALPKDAMLQVAEERIRQLEILVAELLLKNQLLRSGSHTDT